MKNVAIIEDEHNIAEMLSYVLSKHSFTPSIYHSAEEYFLAKKFEENSAYIVDLNLPGMNGLNIIKFIRSHDKISPVFIISGTLNENSINEGLSAGADDYVLKPFNPELLLKKLQNASEKVAQFRESTGLKLVDETHMMMKEGLYVQLTKREYLIVKKLFEAKDKFVTRLELVALFPDADIGLRTIDAHICSARKKLERAGIYVKTGWGKGYCLSEVNPETN